MKLSTLLHREAIEPANEPQGNVGVDSAFGVLLTPVPAKSKARHFTAAKPAAAAAAKKAEPVKKAPTVDRVPAKASSANNGKLAIVAGAVTGLVLIAGYVCFTQLHTSLPSSEHTLAYYTIDDGKTTFAADSSQGMSFTKDGATAVEAVVFTADGKTKVVGYLERPASVADNKLVIGNRVISVKAKPGASAPTTTNYEVKKPGDTKWVPLRSAEGVKIINVKIPGSASEPLRVAP